jgi:predicted ATPase
VAKSCGSSEDDFVLVELRIKWSEVADADAFPFSIPALHQTEGLSLDRPVVFFVGENGSGKSTLLEGLAVAAGFNAEGGRHGVQFTTRASHSTLHEAMQLAWKGSHRKGYFLRAETFYGALTAVEDAYEESGFPRPDLHRQSHGESFLDELDRGATIPALHLLDEPEAALSLIGQLRLLRLMNFGVRAGGQFVISTHSPILLAYPDALIYRLDDTGIRVVGYQETEQYVLTKEFL